MVRALLTHWPEYLMEGALLGTFMVCACGATALLCHPRSPVARAVASPAWKRLIIGVLMGLTAIGLIYSPFGQRSGAHLNPAVTLTFLVLGRVQPSDAAFYVLAQLAGGLFGVGVAVALLGPFVRHESVRFAATLPGRGGVHVAWFAEFVIAFGMMLMVLVSTNTVEIAPYAGLFAGTLVAAYILLEAPLSGMSMNPARTLASAIWARAWRGLWVYFTAPSLGMLAAAAVYTALAGEDSVGCAKLNHLGEARCIFNCRRGADGGPSPPRSRGIEWRPGSGEDKGRSCPETVTMTSSSSARGRAAPRSRRLWRPPASGS